MTTIRQGGLQGGPARFRPLKPTTWWQRFVRLMAATVIGPRRR